MPQLQKPPDLDEYGRPVQTETTKPPDLDQSGNPVDEPSGLSKAWDWYSSPLLEAPARWGKQFADWYTEPRLADMPTGEGGFMDMVKTLGAMQKGAIAGGVEGFGNLVSGLTSPLNITTGVLTGGSTMAGKAGLGSVARMLSGAGKVAAAPMMVHGASEILSPESTLAERGFGAVELAGGGLAMAHRPTIKPRTAEITPPTPEIIPPPVEIKPTAPTPVGKKLTYVVTKDRANSDILGNALDQGWEFVKKNDRGDYVFQKPAPEGMTTAPKAGKQPAPESYTLPQQQASPGNVKKIQESGYKFEGVDDAGNFLFKRTRKTAKMPILEEEVVGKHPTAKAAAEEITRKEIAEGKLGPAMDVKKSNYIAEIFNLPRGLKAAWDLSAPLRQGITLIHKPAFWRAFRPMMESWSSEDGFRASQDAIRARPLFKPSPPSKPTGKPGPSFADEAGLKLTDLVDLSKREEAIMSTWAERVPGVRASNRAYTAFLNNLRADVFEALIRDSDVLGAGGKSNMILARAIADFVNTASGRGSLKGTIGKGPWKVSIDLERAAVALNTTLFSPRLIASRLKLLNPLYYWSAPPVVRKEAVKSLFALAGAGQLVTQLGRMMGGEISADPTSSDFGKLKIGNVRIDPYAGFQQYVVAATRLIGGKSTSSTTGETFDLWQPKGPYDPTIGSTAGRFARGKVHPTLGFIYDIINGSKDMTGKPLDFKTMNPMENAIIQQFIPLFFEDLHEIARTNPELLPIAGPLAGLGVGVQAYERR